MEDYIKTMANRNLLRWTVGRQMFCECGNILDCRSAVLLQTPKGSGCICKACVASGKFDRLIEVAKEKAELEPERFSYLNGKELFARAKRSKQGVKVPRTFSGYYVNGEPVKSLKEAMAKGSARIEYYMPGTSRKWDPEMIARHKTVIELDLTP